MVAPERIHRARQPDSGRAEVPRPCDSARHHRHDCRAGPAAIAAHAKRMGGRRGIRRQRTTHLPRAQPVAHQSQRGPDGTPRRAAPGASRRARRRYIRRALRPRLDVDDRMNDDMAAPLLQKSPEHDGRRPAKTWPPVTLFVLRADTMSMLASDLGAYSPRPPAAQSMSVSVVPPGDRPPPSKSRSEMHPASINWRAR